MINTIKMVLRILTPDERRKSYILLIMILFMAMLEMIGVASIMPFISVLANPEAIQKSKFLEYLYGIHDFENHKEFLYFLGMGVFFLLITSIAFKAITTYVMMRFTFMRDYSISRRLVCAYLHQPYEWFLNRHSADLGKTILAEVQHVTNGTIIPLLQMIAHATLAISIICLLLLVNPKLALTASIVLGLAYVLIYIFLRKYLSHIGVDRLRANQARYQIVQETFSGIKDVKVSGTENNMIRRYEVPAKKYAKHESASQIAGHLPRFALEAVAFGGMIILLLYLLSGNQSLDSTLPIIALYALAGYRLMPALQQVYLQASRIRYTSASLNSLYQDMFSLNMAIEGDNLNKSKSRLPLQHSLELKNISYKYPGAINNALDNLTISIEATTSVGIVGSTGAGKTTLVDIILGLLRPCSGKLLVDGTEVSGGNIRQWQNSIGYVPQHIYLADDTIAANIAFGSLPEKIDINAVKKAAEIANLHDFITEHLPKGYDTLTGERGVRLSGGQRQRIGIARALYHDPSILVLDEATSALDNLTERVVMDAVNKLSHKKTIIIIAHRLSTIRQCDLIFMLEKGNVIATGNFDELFESSNQFRSLAFGTK